LASIILLFAALVILPRHDTTAQESKRWKVVTTTGMIGDIARNVGGVRAQVTAIMGEGVDPHLYKASPGDVRLLSDADIIFYNGMHLEGRMGDVLERLGARKPVIAVTDTIDRNRLRQPPEFLGHFDPHVWFDVSLWMEATKAVRDGFTKLDPAGRGVYDTNAESYLATLRTLHSWTREQIQSIPATSRVLVTAHDAFGYFGVAYGMEVRGIQGISTDSEPSLKDINELVDVIVTRKIRAVFVESSVPRKTIDALVEGARNRGHEVKIGGELFSDAMGRDGTPEGTYDGMVRHNVRLITEALR
jgi:manganese/zinc/iron transport system substrate-binding protein